MSLAPLHIETRRRTLVSLLLLALVAGTTFLGLPQHAYAITIDDLLNQNSGWQCVDNNPSHASPRHILDCTKGDRTAYCYQQGVAGDGGVQTFCFENANGQTVSQSASGAGTTINVDEAGHASVDSPVATAAAVAGNFVLAAILAPIAAVSYLIMAVAGALLGIATLLFNLAVKYLVFEFSTYLGNSTGMLLAWGILRDFGNIGLLFGFVFMGISTILDLHSYPWKKALPLLVIFAVLLNFSLFAAEAVIDSANVLASQLYQTSFGVEGTGGATSDVINTGVAGAVLQGSGLADIFANYNAGNILDYVANPVGTTITYLGMAIFFTTAMVVFIAGAILLISRAITLAFIMVTSPIGFAGMAIPPLAGIAKDWWHKLISQALFAPVFLLLLLVALKLSEGLRSITAGGSIATAISGNNSGGAFSNPGPILFFVLIIGFMLGALLIAKQFGIYGAEAVTKQGMAVIGGATGAMTFGAAGWGLRRTLGGTANIASRSLRTGRLRGLGNMPIIGKRITGLADKGASASFDGRGKGGALGGPGEAAQKGARGERAAITKGEEEFRKSITEQEVEDYKNLKGQKQSFRDALKRKVGREDMDDAEFDKLMKRAATSAPAGSPLAAAANGSEMKEMKRLTDLMDKTPEGKRENAKDKLEKRDDHVKEWTEANTQLKEATANLARIARIKQNPPRGTDMVRLAAEEADYIKQRDKAEATQADLNPKILGLTDEIKLLRKEIKRDESRYRKGVQDVARPNIPLNPIDRRALHGFTVKKVDETVFKPKDLVAALPRAFRVKNNL